MNNDEQAAFINSALGPQLESAFPDVKLYCYDHNWDVTEYAKAVITGASKYTDGTAWHHYCGEPEAQSEVHFTDESKETHFSEGSGGSWVPPFHKAFQTIIAEGIAIFRNWSKSYILWNLSLDEKNGPFMPSNEGRSTCRGIVKVNTQTGELTYNLDYYSLAHFSKFIDTGAVRVYSDNNGRIATLACENTDGTTAVVAHNSGDNGINVRFCIGESSFEYYMTGYSAVTFCYRIKAD